MSKYAERFKSFHEQIILIQGFLGGVVFAGLVLLIQKPDFITQNLTLANDISPITTNEYFFFLCGFLAFISGLSSLSCFIAIRSVSEKFESFKSMKTLSGAQDKLFAIVFIGFVYSLTLLLVPVNAIIGTVFIFLFTGMIAYTGLSLRKARRTEREYREEQDNAHSAEEY